VDINNTRWAHRGDGLLKYPMTPIRFNHDFDPQYGNVVEVVPGVRRIVATNSGPFTGPGTGTYIIGEGEVAVVDPGPMIPAHIDALLKGLGDEKVSHILVTHTHVDHSPASVLLKHKTGAPVFSFGPHSALAAGAMEGGMDRDFMPDFLVKDGEKINGAGWYVEAVHTPGHCSNHLCFAMPETDSLFCGDQLMAWATTVILPPDGSLGAYLESLDTLEARPETTFYPTHGRPIDKPRETIQAYRQHRHDRLDQINAVLNAGHATLPEMRQQIYQGIPSALHAGAELSLLASLEYMEQQGKVRRLSDPSDYPGWEMQTRS